MIEATTHQSSRKRASGQHDRHGNAEGGGLERKRHAEQLCLECVENQHDEPITGETAGKIVFGFAVFALVAGGVWLKKLVKVDF